MAIATEQLEAIKQEITQTFSDDPRITVVPVDGNPPEKYEVTYNLDGLQKTDAGAVEKANSHTIAISIPFGYPHFPPSCKPKSPIFHPDFDPAAICIGDFWEKNRSITDLISHIGEMIAGTHYSTANAFNEEAAQWYAENFSSADSAQDKVIDTDDSDDFSRSLSPASEEDFTSLLEDVDEQVEEDLLEPFDSGADEDIAPALSFVDDSDDQKEESNDSVGDNLFEESDFDFEVSSPEEGAADEDAVPPQLKDFPAGEMDDEDLDVDHFNELAAEKRFFGLDKELSLLAGSVAFDGKEALAERAAVALERAQSLYTKALELEHQGEPAEALKYFKEIKTVTTDYPGLHEDISRMSQALELLGDWTTPTVDRPAETETILETETQAEEVSAPPPPVQAEPQQVDEPELNAEKAASRTFFEDESEPKSRLLPYALLVVILLVGAAAGANYYLSSSKYEQAEKRFADCLGSLKNNLFSDAELQCESALGLAKQVRLFKAGERDALIIDIEKTLRSEPLKQGLAGNLLLDGRYYPRQVVQNITSFRDFKRKGDELYAASSWQQSVSNYDQALQIAAEEKAIDRQELFQISENIRISRFNITYESGLSYIERKKWVLATKDLTGALDQLKALSLPDKAGLIDEITHKLGQIEQATEKEKGDSAFSEGEWSKASEHYRKALMVASQSFDPDQDAIYELKQLVVKGDLYAIVSSGKSAFRQSRWDEAIASYDKAINLLEDNRELLKQTNTEENRKKLARIMLQASIIRDNQDAARHLKEKEFNQAVTKLKAVLTSISASEFQTEPEFEAIRQEAEQSIKQAQTDKLMADKITYLEENFEELFTKHYAGSPPESLQEREVVFEKQMGSRLLFRLQCVEVGRGRPLQLVMKYTNDLDTGKWEFYRDSQ
jgi:ubiquitin-protein ligase